MTVIDAAKADLVAFKLNAMDKKFKFKVRPYPTLLSWVFNRPAVGFPLRIRFRLLLLRA